MKLIKLRCYKTKKNCIHCKKENQTTVSILCLLDLYLNVYLHCIEVDELLQNG